MQRKNQGRFQEMHILQILKQRQVLQSEGSVLKTRQLKKSQNERAMKGVFVRQGGKTHWSLAPTPTVKSIEL